MEKSISQKPPKTVLFLFFDDMDFLRISKNKIGFYIDFWFKKKNPFVASCSCPTPQAIFILMWLGIHWESAPHTPGTDATVRSVRRDLLPPAT